MRRYLIFLINPRNVFFLHKLFVLPDVIVIVLCYVSHVIQKQMNIDYC